MSAYCTRADIEGEIQAADLIKLTDDSATGDVDLTVLNQAIENASGVVDRYAGNLYTTPFSPIPVAVKSAAIVICCYRLYRRRLVPDEKNNFTEDYERTIKFLEAVNSREKTLGLDAEQDFGQVAANTCDSPWGGGNTLNRSL